MGAATALDEQVLSKYGTDDYMAPEVALVEKTRKAYHGLKADIFSLGICIFILNFGLPPWQSPNEDTCRLYKRFKDDKNHFLRTHPGTKKRFLEGKIDEELLDIINMLCKHDPSERPDSLVEVMDHPYLCSKSADSVTAEALEALLKK